MSFMLFEILLWGLFLVSILDANKRWGLKSTALFFFPLFIYGWVLEASAIGIFQRYEYGDGFFVTLFGAPLCIAAGWACITYSGICIAKSFTNNHYKIAVFTALWGLCIDFSMDGLAVLMGYWTWFAPDDVVLPYFDVPVSNFIGWFIILSCFSYFHLTWKETKARKALMGFDVIFPSLSALLIAILVMLESRYEVIFSHLQWWQMTLILVVPQSICLFIWLYNHADKITKELTIPLAINHIFHAFFFTIALIVLFTESDGRFVLLSVLVYIPFLALPLSKLTKMGMPLAGRKSL